VDRALGFGAGVPGSISSSGKNFVFETLLLVLDPYIKQKRPNSRVTFSMGYAGASGKSPNDAP